MVYTNLKNTAVSLRKQGWSYSEIKTRVPVSKATLSNWFKGIRLSPIQRSRLKQKRIEAAKRGLEKKIAQIRQSIEEIQKNSSQNISQISKREFWLMGVMLYWREVSEEDLKKGVRFSSSNPHLINFFLKWLKESGKIPDEDIKFDLFLKEEKKDPAIKYWSEITGFLESNFTHVYFQKIKPKRLKRKRIKKYNFGTLRIRIRASSMLARQIAGWIKGIKDC